MGPVEGKPRPGREELVFRVELHDGRESLRGENRPVVRFLRAEDAHGAGSADAEPLAGGEGPSHAPGESLLRRREGVRRAFRADGFPRRGKEFSGVETSRGVESAFQVALQGKLLLGEDQAHRLALFEADSVLPGDRPPEFDAGLEDLFARAVHALELIGAA